MGEVSKLNKEYKIKEEFIENSKTLEEILDEVFISYLVEKVEEESWKTFFFNI